MPKDPRHRDATVTEKMLRTGRPQDINVLRRLHTQLQPAPSMKESVPAAVREQAMRNFDLPPWLFPPFGALSIDAPFDGSQFDIAAGASATITFPDVPAGRIGVVRKIGFTASDVVNAVLSTRIDNEPVFPYPAKIGPVGSPEDPFELAMPILIPAPKRFTVVITNLAAVIINAQVRIVGWMYTQ